MATASSNHGDRSEKDKNPDAVDKTLIVEDLSDDHIDDGELKDFETRLPTAIGTVISTVLAAALTVPCLKAGYMPPVSNLTIMPFTTLKAKGMIQWVDKFFVCIAQAAGTAGTAVTSGIAFGYPAGLMLQRQKLREGVEFGKTEDDLTVEGVCLMVECFAGILVGSGFTQIFTTMLLQGGKYPMPEAHLCVAMLNLIQTENEMPYLAQSLWGPLVLVAMVTLGKLMGYLPDNVSFHTFTKDMAKTRKLPIDGQLAGTRIQLPAAGGIITMGVGAVLPVSVVALSCAGSVFNLFGNVMYLQVRTGGIFADWKDDNYVDQQFPDGRAMQWTGAGAMTVAIAWTLVKVMYMLISSLRKSRAEDKSSDDDNNAAEPLAQEKSETSRKTVLDKIGVTEDELLEIPRRYAIQQWISIILGMLIHLVVLISFKVKISFLIGNMIVTVVGGALMTYLGALLSLQIGSGSSPVSGTTLVLGLAHCVNLIVTVGSGTIESVEQELLKKYIPVTALSLCMNCVATCFANDAVQDYATMWLLKTKVSLAFTAKLVACMPACVIVPLILYVADKSIGELGDKDGLVAPQAGTISAVFGGVLWGAPAFWPLGFGAILGFFAVLNEEIFRKFRGMELPAMAFCVGCYLPPVVALSMAFGSASKCLGKALYYKYVQPPSERGAEWETQEISLCAASFMTGYSIIILCLGIILNVDANFADTLNIVEYATCAKGDQSCPIYVLPGLATIIILCATMTYNAYSGHMDPTFAIEVQNDESDNGNASNGKAGDVELSSRH